ncbi:MAG: SURF1 family protein [Pseudomonadales bacterium]|nr:SURF1 family protein [Pseudomonadales bacterium]
MGIKLGQREFAPSWLMTVATILFGSLFVTLGFWQWQRGAERQATWDAFARSTNSAIEVGTAHLAVLPEFSRVRLRGSYAPERQFLLDNRIFDGRAGYEILTPFVLTDGHVVLVNRGWIPFAGFRDQLPDVAFDAPHVSTIVGRIDELPSAGLASGRAAPQTTAGWPRVTSFPRMTELAAALGRPLESRIVLLDADAAYGYERHWAAPGLNPMRHVGYAVQWWGFAVVLLGLYVGLNLRKVV